MPAATRERVALAVAEFNGCNYCLSAHTYLGTNLAKLDAAEIAANRAGFSNDAKADAAVRFAVKVAQAAGPGRFRTICRRCAMPDTMTPRLSRSCSMWL